MFLKGLVLFVVFGGWGEPPSLVNATAQDLPLSDNLKLQSDGLTKGGASGKIGEGPG